jgi:hypothetical protein
MKSTIRIGAGAGYADDRIEPARELVEHGDLDYLIFECLAERTLALSQLDRLQDQGAGYNEWLEDRMEAVLPAAAARGTRIITNMGAANPLAAARVVRGVADRLGLTRLRIAAVTGDDVLDVVRFSELPLLEPIGTIASLGDSIVSANAYLGIDALLPALELGADVIIGGRIADPSLFLAPLVHEFGWETDDWTRLGVGTAVGHLLECAGHVTGGYFADPPFKTVPHLATLGNPLAEVSSEGDVVITKVAGSGGLVSVATVTEQLLYEVHDPSRYLTPDVTADFSGATLQQVGEDRVAVRGIGGTPRPDMQKVSVGYVDSFIGEGQISYAGPNALARGRLALDVVRERLTRLGIPMLESRFEVIGVDAVHRGLDGDAASRAFVYDPPEVRVRAVARTTDLAHARRVGHEVTTLALNGPAGGAGPTRSARRNVAIASVLVPRESVSVETTMIEATA